MRKILLFVLLVVITSCTKKDVRSYNYWNDETAEYDGGKENEINTIYKRKSYKRIEKKSTEKFYYESGNVKQEIKVNEEYQKPFRPWEIFKSGQGYLHCCQISKSDRPLLIKRDNLELYYKDQGLSVGADSAVNIKEQEIRNTIVTNMDNGSRLAEELRTEYNVEGTTWYEQSYPEGIKLFEIKIKWDPDAKDRDEDNWLKEDVVLIRKYFSDGTGIAEEKIFKNGELNQLILYSAFDGRKRVIEKDDFDRLGISH